MLVIQRSILKIGIATSFTLWWVVACVGTASNRNDLTSPPNTVTATASMIHTPTPIELLTSTATPRAVVSATTISPLATSTLFSTPTLSPTILPILTPSILLEGPLVAFAQNEPSPPNSLLLVDIGTRSNRHLQFEEGQPLRVSWSADGCYLNITLWESTGIELVQSDLSGKIVEHFQVSTHQSSDPSAFNSEWVISPTGEYIAYITFSGEQYYATSEFQNLKVEFSNNESNPIALTTNGGALSFAWSPDGAYLAYSDFDDAGIRQLYRSQPDGSEKIQLTFFQDRGAPIGEPKGNYISKPVWSPDGHAIAIEAGITDADGAFIASVWVVSTEDGTQLQVIPDTVSDTAIMGWSEDSTVLAVYQYEGDIEDGALIWINAEDGSLINTLESGRVADSDVTLLAAVRGIQLWVGEDQMQTTYLYDLTTENLELAKDILWPASGLLLDNARISFGEAISPGQVIDAAVSPTGFLSETSCREIYR